MWFGMVQCIYIGGVFVFQCIDDFLVIYFGCVDYFGGQVCDGFVVGEQIFVVFDWDVVVYIGFSWVEFS